VSQVGRSQRCASMEARPSLRRGALAIEVAPRHVTLLLAAKGRSQLRLKPFKRSFLQTRRLAIIDVLTNDILKIGVGLQAQTRGA